MLSLFPVRMTKSLPAHNQHPVDTGQVLIKLTDEVLIERTCQHKFSAAEN